LPILLPHLLSYSKPLAVQYLLEGFLGYP
jgi:hypothetical protein